MSPFLWGCRMGVWIERNTLGAFSSGGPLSPVVVVVFSVW